MKQLLHACCLLMFAMASSSCQPARSTALPVQTESQSPAPTGIDSTPTHPPKLTVIPTFTPPPTLDAEQAKETVSELLQKPVDCPAPCFWGIIPGQSTLNEARTVFGHLGLGISQIASLGKDYYETRYSFESGLSISASLAVQGGIVQSVRVSILPEPQRPGVPRAWLAYSPQSLIERYGMSSRADFIVGHAEPGTSYTITLHFDAQDLIVQYAGDAASPSHFRICPLTDVQQSVGVWFGKDPQYPPPEGVPLEDATSLTMPGFSQLMTGNPDNACIKPKLDNFP